MPARWLLWLAIALCAACPAAEEPAAPPPAMEPPDDELPPPTAPGWERPLDRDEPPPTGHAGLYAMARDRVGPLYRELPAELSFLQWVFSDFDVRHTIQVLERERRQRVFEIYDAGTRLIVVEPALAGSSAGRDIRRVRVHSSLFRAPGDVGVGDSFARVSRRFGPLQCRASEIPGSGQGAAECRGPGESGRVFRWIFQAPHAALSGDWASPARSAELLAGQPVREVWWLPASP